MLQFPVYNRHVPLFLYSYVSLTVQYVLVKITKTQLMHNYPHPPLHWNCSASGTHRVPHDDVDIWAERVVDMLGYVEVNKVTEVVVHVHPYLKNIQLLFFINMPQSMLLHTVKMNCRNIFIQCLDSTNWMHTNVEKEHVYCVL